MIKPKLFIAIVFLFACFFSRANDTATVNRILRAAQDSIQVRSMEGARGAFEKALALSRQIRYDSGTGIALAGIGSIVGAHDRHAGIRLYTEALPLLNKVGSPKRLSVLYTLSDLHENISNLDSSIYYTIRAIALLGTDKQFSTDIWPIVKLSALYLHIDEYDKALLYARRAVDVSQTSDYLPYRVGPLIALSRAFRFRDADSALYYTRELNPLLTESGSFEKCKIYNHFADIANFRSMPDSALYYGKLALQLHETRQVALEDLVNTYLFLADAHLAKQQFAEAINALEKADAHARRRNFTVARAGWMTRMARATFGLGRYREAYLYKDSAFAFQQQLSGTKNKIVISDLDIQYQTSLREKALADQRLVSAEKDLALQRSRQYVWYSVLAAAIALTILLLFYLQARNRRRIHTRQMMELKQQREIQLLQALMEGEEKERSRIAKDLHDGVAGMLAAVKMHFNSISPAFPGVKEAPGYNQGIRLLDDASIEIRKVSHNLMPEVLQLYGLDEAIRRYCASISNPGSFVVQFDSWGKLGRYIDSFELSVYRIVQELLNNVVKHAGASEAIVQLSVQQDILSITIEDNGVGLPASPGSRDGMGLHNLQARMQAIHGRIEISQSGPGGMGCYLEFDVQGLEKETGGNHE